MKKILRQIISWSMVLALFALLTGCGHNTQKAEQSVSEMLDGMKHAEITHIQQFFPEQLEQEDATDADSKALLQAMFKNLQYTILSSEETAKDTIAVKTEISNANLVEAFRMSVGKILNLSLENAFGNTLSDQEMSEKAFAVFISHIDSLTAEPVKTTVTISVKKENGKWKPVADTAVADAALGGLVTVFSQMEQAMGNAN